MTYFMMQERINIDATALNTILAEHLEVRRISARWVSLISKPTKGEEGEKCRKNK